MRYAILMLLLCACYPSNQAASTRCGLVAGGDYRTGAIDWLSVDVLQEAEDVFLRAMQATADARLNDPALACAELEGFHVYTRAEVSWKFDEQEEINGMTTCAIHVMVIGEPRNHSWRSTSLSHELVHAAQNCRTTGDNTGHGHWKESGVWNVIGDIQASRELHQ